MKRLLRPSHVEDALTRLFGPEARVRTTELLELRWVVRIRLLDVDPLVDSVRQLETPGSSSSSAPLPAAERSSLERMLVTAVRDDLLSHTQVHGVAGIRGATVEQNQRIGFGSGGEVRQDPEFYIECAGTNLRALAELPFVDPTRLHSNDLHELHATLGIEAVLLFLCHETENVLSFDGTYIDVHHIYLLGEKMCFDGAPAAMTRHGMRSRSVLMRASFEETQEILYQSALYGRDDPIQGVTEKIMLGRPTRIGSGHCDVVPDPTLVPPPEPIVTVAPATFRSTRRMISEYNRRALLSSPSSSEAASEDSDQSSTRGSFAGRRRTPTTAAEEEGEQQQVFHVSSLRSRMRTAAAGTPADPEPSNRARACSTFYPLLLDRLALPPALKHPRATRVYTPLRCS